MNGASLPLPRMAPDSHFLGMPLCMQVRYLGYSPYHLYTGRSLIPSWTLLPWLDES